MEGRQQSEFEFVTSDVDIEKALLCLWGCGGVGSRGRETHREGSSPTDGRDFKSMIMMTDDNRDKEG